VKYAYQEWPHPEDGFHGKHYLIVLDVCPGKSLYIYNTLKWLKKELLKTTPNTTNNLLKALFGRACSWTVMAMHTCTQYLHITVLNGLLGVIDSRYFTLYYVTTLYMLAFMMSER
jgi:hypothetical protein